MAIDTARVKLELASGRNQITAPFVYTALRKRSKPEDAARVETVEATDEPPAAAQVVVDVPLAAVDAVLEAPAIAPAIIERPGAARPPWIAVIAALIVVAATVWWIMSQRLPAIDPQVVIQRNLDDARQAMAAGHYTDPAERSAFHYFNTVLALDPSNAAAVSGIEAIADRHITDARVLLSQQRIAEAGVALDKARRVRPNHSGLAALDVQFRSELRKMLIASTAASQATAAASATKPRTRPTRQRPLGWRLSGVTARQRSEQHPHLPHLRQQHRKQLRLQDRRWGARKQSTAHRAPA